MGKFYVDFVAHRGYVIEAEDENSPNQETFECIECGYKDNADLMPQRI